MKLSELKKMATENGISLKHLTGKMLKKSELAEKLMTKGVMLKSPKKSRKTSRKPKKTSRKPVKKSRKPVKKSRKPKKVRKYMMKKRPTKGKRKSEKWTLIHAEIEKLLTNEKITGYKISGSHRLHYIKKPRVVSVRFVYDIKGGDFEWISWVPQRIPISVGILEMKIYLGEDGVPRFTIAKGGISGNLENTNEGTSSTVERSLVEKKTIPDIERSALWITKRVKMAFGLNTMK